MITDLMQSVMSQQSAGKPNQDLAFDRMLLGGKSIASLSRKLINDAEKEILYANNRTVDINISQPEHSLTSQFGKEVYRSIRCFLPRLLAGFHYEVQHYHKDIVDHIDQLFPSRDDRTPFSTLLASASAYNSGKIGEALKACEHSGWSIVYKFFQDLTEEQKQSLGEFYEEPDISEYSDFDDEALIKSLREELAQHDLGNFSEMLCLTTRIYLSMGNAPMFRQYVFSGLAYCNAGIIDNSWDKLHIGLCGLIIECQEGRHVSKFDMSSIRIKSEIMSIRKIVSNTPLTLRSLRLFEPMFYILQKCHMFTELTELSLDLLNRIEEMRNIYDLPENRNEALARLNILQLSDSNVTKLAHLPKLTKYLRVWITLASSEYAKVMLCKEKTGISGVHTFQKLSSE